MRKAKCIAGPGRHTAERPTGNPPEPPDIIPYGNLMREGPVVFNWTGFPGRGSFLVIIGENANIPPGAKMARRPVGFSGGFACLRGGYRAIRRRASSLVITLSNVGICAAAFSIKA